MEKKGEIMRVKPGKMFPLSDKDEHQELTII
jgi:hypothetical protein